MISKHCGQYLVTKADNPVYFLKTCRQCGKVFKQRKRRKEAR